MGKIVHRTKTVRIVENKNGTRSTYTSYRCNGKTKWHKTGGPSTAHARKKN